MDMIKAEICEICKKNPEKWKTLAKDCISNMPFDDLEDVCRRNGWKLPLESYLNYYNLIRPHVLEMCMQDSKMWENVARALIGYMPADFVEYLSEEYNWLV